MKFFVCPEESYIYKLWAMNDWLAANGFIGALAFREKIVSGIQRSTEDISTWLPEWGILRTLIANKDWQRK
jgi:hypothetical protein